jgi:hypothetical protein
MTGTTYKPLLPAVARAQFREVRADGDPATSKQVGYLAGLLTSAFEERGADPAKNRRSVIRYLADVGSLRDLSKYQASWLIELLRDEETGDLHTDAEQLLWRILHEAMKDAGQATLPGFDF